jgi:hypothetical protein
MQMKSLEDAEITVDWTTDWNSREQYLILGFLSKIGLSGLYWSVIYPAFKEGPSLLVMSYASSVSKSELTPESITSLLFATPGEGNAIAFSPVISKSGQSANFTLLAAVFSEGLRAAEQLKMETIQYQVYEGQPFLARSLERLGLSSRPNPNEFGDIIYEGKTAEFSSRLGLRDISISEILDPRFINDVNRDPLFCFLSGTTVGGLGRLPGTLGDPQSGGRSNPVAAEPGVPYPPSPTPPDPKPPSEPGVP